MLEVKRWRISKSTTSPGPHCLNTYIGIFVFCKLQIKTYWTGFKLSLTIKSWENHFHTRLSHNLKIIRAYMSKLESEPRAIKVVVEDEKEEHLSSFWLFWLMQIPTVLVYVFTTEDLSAIKNSIENSLKKCDIGFSFSFWTTQFWTNRTGLGWATIDFSMRWRGDQLGFC